MTTLDPFTVGHDDGKKEDRAGAEEREEEEEEEEEEVEEDDDYMNMVIAEPTKPREKETYTQRRLRKEREAELKRPRSKAELEQLAIEKREEALSRAIHDVDPSRKGLKMMQAMGFQPGDVLGRPNQGSDARKEPIGLHLKDDRRAGIGLETEKKRKFRLVMTEESKRQKVDEGDFRERVRQDREKRRLEAQVLAAQKVAERLHAVTTVHTHMAQPQSDHTEEDDNNFDSDVGNSLREAGSTREHRSQHHHHRRRQASDEDVTVNSDSTPLKQINILWRGLARDRAQAEQQRRIRHYLQQSLSRLPTYEDDDDDDDDDNRLALGHDHDHKPAVLEEELEEDDPDLDEFNNLPPLDRLTKLVSYLRQTNHYCFWCKYQYPDELMDGCPGVTEEDHD